MFAKLRGMFAFVIYDKNKKELVGARDHFGIKPFYYYKNDGNFMFGSEIKSFLEHPDFKKLRYIGKRCNFAKNYGAQRGKIRQMFPEYDEEQITKIDEAYYKAFPWVKQYHEYCYQRASYYAYTQNLFGIKYYGVNGHKLINMLVQGSAAFYLKMKIRELYEFRHKHNLKTRIQMQIHDELSWEYNSEDDPKIFFEFQKIMQDWDDALVPIVADMEVTTTTWAEKKDVNNLEELKEKLEEI